MNLKLHHNKIKLLVLAVLLVLFFSYSFMVYTIGTEPENGGKISAAAVEGKMVWQKYNCISCHQLYGLGGYMGPDLTNVISAPGKGKHFARAFIATGSSKMPNFKLSEKEMETLLEFLNYVDKTGRSPHFELSATLWGDVIEKEEADSFITLETHVSK